MKIAAGVVTAASAAIVGLVVLCVVSTVYVATFIAVSHSGHWPFVVWWAAVLMLPNALTVVCLLAAKK
jgi:hypothetical protein